MKALKAPFILAAGLFTMTMAIYGVVYISGSLVRMLVGLVLVVGGGVWITAEAMLRESDT